MSSADRSPASRTRPSPSCEGTLTVSGQEIRDGAYVPQSNPEPMHYDLR